LQNIELNIYWRKLKSKKFVEKLDFSLPIFNVMYLNNYNQEKSKKQARGFNFSSVIKFYREVYYSKLKIILIVRSVKR